MTLLESLLILLLIILVMLDTFSTCRISCSKCDKVFENTIFGACVLFDWHFIKEHKLK